MPLSPADIRNAILLSVATVAAGFMLPVSDAFIIALPVAAFSLGWLSYRFGTRLGVIVALVAAIPVLIVNPRGTHPADAAFVAATLVAAGPVAAWALRRFSAYGVVAGVTLLATAAFLLAPIGAATLQGATETTRIIGRALVQSGSVTDTATLNAAIAQAVTQTTTTWPATVATLFGIAAFLAMPLVSWAGRSLGQQVHRYTPLAETDLTFHLVWPAIAGLALVAAGTFWGGGKGLVYATGLNVLMIVRPALALQGLSVFAALYRRINAGRVWRGVGFTLLVLTELMIPSLSVVGAVDLFANLRRLPRHGVPVPVSKERM